MERRYVMQLKEGDQLQQVFLCKHKNMLKDRNGRSYLTMTLADRTGAVDALLWEEAERQARGFTESDLVEVVGKAVLLQGRLQLHLTEITKAGDCPLPATEFLTAPRQDPGEGFQELVQLLGTVEEPALAALTQVLLDDAELMEALRQGPAARTIHHAYPGGLLVHTLSVMRLVDAICTHYGPVLNRDYCVLGAFLHDLGKTCELSVSQGIHYTDEGRLLGHVTLGLQMLDRAMATAGTPDDVALHLRHIHLSHHGKLEHGSPKRPKTMEAFVVHRADELDSALTSMKELLEQPSTNGWTAYQALFDRYLFQGPKDGR